jgi:hypothetical protein
MTPNQPGGGDGEKRACFRIEIWFANYRGPHLTRKRLAGVVPRRAKLEAPAPRDPGPLPSVRPVCAATRGLTRRRF